MSSKTFIMENVYKPLNDEPVIFYSLFFVISEFAHTDLVLGRD